MGDFFELICYVSWAFYVAFSCYMILKLERRVTELEDFKELVSGCFRPSSDKRNCQGSEQVNTND